MNVLLAEDNPVNQEVAIGLLETLDANYLGWSSEMAPAIMGVPDHPEYGEELTASFCRTDPDIARHFAHVTFLADHRADVFLATKTGDRDGAGARASLERSLERMGVSHVAQCFCDPDEVRLSQVELR